MPIIRCKGSCQGVNAMGELECFTVVEGATEWSRENHTYLPITFVRRKLAEYRRRRIEVVDAAVFLLFFVVYLVVLQFEYFSKMEGYYWASEAVVSAFERRQFRPLARFSKLRDGEVDLYHAGRSFTSIYTAQDWHHWLRDVVVDGLFNATLIPTEAQMGQNKINYFRDGGQLVKIGALRVRALRVVEACRAGRISETCGHHYTREALDRSPFGPMNFSECAPWVLIEGFVRYDYSCGGVVLDIPFNSSYAVAVSAVQSLTVAEESTTTATNLSSSFQDVVDPETVRGLSVEFVLYLPTVDAYVLVSCFTEIPLGGGFVSKVNTVVLSRDMPLDTLLCMAVCFLLLCVLIGLVAYRQAEYLWRSATAFEGQGVVIGRFAVWVSHICVLIGHLVCMCLRVVRTPSIPTDGSSSVFDERIWEAYMLYRVEVYLAAFAVLFSVGRLLTVFKFLPLMKTVAITFVVAFKNMMSVGLAFVILIVGYAISGYFLFCDAVEGFRDPWASLQTVVVALLGEFDYDDLRLSVPGAAPIIYYWSFIIVTVSICFNFIVGILGGALEKVTDSEEGESESAQKSLGVWTLLKRSFHQWRWEMYCCFIHMSAIDSLQETLEQVWAAEMHKIICDAFGEDSRKRTASLNSEELVVTVAKKDEVDFFLKFTLIKYAGEGLPTQWARQSKDRNDNGDRIPCFHISDVDLLMLQERRRKLYAKGESVKARRERSLFQSFKRWRTKPLRVDSSVISYLWFGDAENYFEEVSGVSEVETRRRGRDGPSGAPTQRALSQQFAELTTADGGSARDLFEKAERALENSYAELLRELDDMAHKVAILEDWYARRAGARGGGRFRSD